MFVDLKEHNWTFVLSTLKAQPTYDPNDKTNVWGGYNYVPTSDVVRVPMKLETAPHAHEQLSWEFVDVTPTSGVLALQWDKGHRHGAVHGWRIGETRGSGSGFTGEP